jgi:SP family general alpha glucoside:H+ symporter-like MFS transporter
MEKESSEMSKEVSPSRLELEDIELEMKMQGSNLNHAAMEAAVMEHQLGAMAAIKGFVSPISFVILAEVSSARLCLWSYRM